MYARWRLKMVIKMGTFIFDTVIGFIGNMSVILKRPLHGKQITYTKRTTSVTLLLILINDRMENGSWSLRSDFFR